MNNTENLTQAQRRTIQGIGQEITRIAEAGEGHVCVDWIEDDGRQFQILVNEAGQRVGFEREIWC